MRYFPRGGSIFANLLSKRPNLQGQLIQLEVTR